MLEYPSMAHKCVRHKNIKGGDIMTEPTKYFVVTKKAVPEVLLKVVEAKRLLESGKLPTIQDAVDAVGISRSSFYKYKDDIFPFHDSTQGKTVTLSMQIEDLSLIHI